MTCGVPECQQLSVTTGVCSQHWLEADEAARGAERIEAELRKARADEAEVVAEAEAKWHRDRFTYGQHIGGTTYQRYLRSRQWAGTRALAIHRADGMCEVCGETQYLEVHHKTYERLGNETHDDLIVLCSSCHAKVHDKPARSAWSRSWGSDWGSRW